MSSGGNLLWLPASFVPAPAVGEVHVWLAWVPGGAQPDAAVLSAEERQRAARFVFECDRRAFVFHHATLRRVLSVYLPATPASLIFERGENGKPALAPPHAGWRFNLSHSGEAGLYGVARGMEVGVDIERVRPVRHARSIAERFLKQPEPADFFALWTRREAAVKASGVGLAGLADEPSGVCFLELPPVPGYAAALAVAGAGEFAVRTFLHYQPDKQPKKTEI